MRGNLAGGAMPAIDHPARYPVHAGISALAYDDSLPTRPSQDHARSWEPKGVPVCTIQFLLGNRSLETTMRYLGITNLDSLTDKIGSAAPFATADVEH
jgi:hypothetical protein